MIRFRNMKKRDLLRLAVPYLASVVVIGAVFIMQDGFIRNLSSKVLSVFGRDTRNTAVILADMAMEENPEILFGEYPGSETGNLVLEPSSALQSLLRLERASVVFGLDGARPVPRDSLEDAAIESGELLSMRIEAADRGDAGLVRAVYPVFDENGGIIAFSSVTMLEPYSVRWLATLRYAMLVLFAVILALVMFPRMLFDISEMRRQRELDGFDQSRDGEMETAVSPDISSALAEVMESIDLASGVPSLLLRADGAIEYMSPGAGILFDVSPLDGSGCTLGDLPSVRDTPSVAELTGTDPVELSITHSSGEEVRVTLRGSASGDREGAPIIIVAPSPYNNVGVAVPIHIPCTRHRAAK